MNIEDFLIFLCLMGSVLDYVSGDEVSSTQRLWNNPRCKEGTYMTIYNNYRTHIHECSECKGIYDVLITLKETEVLYEQTFTQIEDLCANYLLYFMAVETRSFTDLTEYLQTTRREQYLGSLDGYLLDVQYACNGSTALCDQAKGGIKQCKEGYSPVFTAPTQDDPSLTERTIIKCVQNCTYGLFIPTQGGCYPGYCEKEDEVLTLSFVDHPKMEVNICQFAERRHILNHTRYSEEVYLYLKGRCTTCREPGEFWAYQTHNRNEGPKQSICGRCYNWNMGMPGLLEKCQSSTCVCGDNGQCVSCKNRSDFKFYNRQGEWKYCYGRCEGNLSSGVLSFKGHGKHHKTECHLYGCSDGLTPVVKEKRNGKFKNFVCKKHKCRTDNDEYMISVNVPGTIFWKTFNIDICVIK